MEHGKPLARLCTRTAEWVSLELDGELSEFERVSLQEHLSSCARCAELAHAFAATADVLRSAALETLPRPVELPARAAAWRGGGVRLTAAVAAAVVAAAVPLGLAMRKGESLPPSFAGATPTSPDLVQLRAIRRAQLHLAAASLNNVRVRARIG